MSNDTAVDQLDPPIGEIEPQHTSRIFQWKAKSGVLSPPRVGAARGWGVWASFVACALITILATLGATSASASYRYVYRGQKFTTNTLSGSSRIWMIVIFDKPLLPDTTYGIKSQELRLIKITDGVDTIERHEGTLLDTSFIKTNDQGQISSWEIVELSGADRSFVDPGECCTINDPPLMYSVNHNGQTDASIQTNGVFGIGPSTGYGYNNLMPGTWTQIKPALPVAERFEAQSAIPEPRSWILLLAGLLGLGGLFRRERAVRFARS